MNKTAQPARGSARRPVHRKSKTGEGGLPENSHYELGKGQLKVSIEGQGGEGGGGGNQHHEAAGQEWGERMNRLAAGDGGGGEKAAPLYATAAATGVNDRLAKLKGLRAARKSEGGDALALHGLPSIPPATAGASHLGTNGNNGNASHMHAHLSTGNLPPLPQKQLSTSGMLGAGRMNPKDDPLPTFSRRSVISPTGDVGGGGGGGPSSPR